MCREGAPNPAVTLELMPLFGPLLARPFFTVESLVKVQSLLECGGITRAVARDRLPDGGRLRRRSRREGGDRYSQVEYSRSPAEVRSPRSTRSAARKRVIAGRATRRARTSSSIAVRPRRRCSKTATPGSSESGSRWKPSRGASRRRRRSLSTALTALNDAANEVEGLSNLPDRVAARVFAAFPRGTPCAWAASPNDRK